MALLRNKGHTGTREAIAMIAGDEARGAFRSKSIVIEYEHKAATAAKLISQEFHESMDALACVGFLRIEGFCYKGDATNQEAIDKQKVHVSTIDTIAMQIPPDAATPPEASCHRARCDLQIVVDGTGQ